MTQRIILSATMVLFAISVQAQIFWRVSGNGLSKDSYIFGTVHIAPESLIDEVTGLNEAINNCDIALGESEDTPSMDKESAVKYMMAPMDSTLDQLLSPEDYRIVEAVVDSCSKEIGLSLEQLRFLKPNVIGYLVDFSSVPNPVFGNEKNEKSLDDIILDRAVAAGHPRMHLDSTEEVIDLFFNCPLKDQAAFLLEQCKSEDFKKESQEKMDAYLRQEMPEPDEDEDEMFQEMFVNSRNRRWVTRLLPLMSSGKSCLVVVGAGHLPGKQGLLQLLRNEGYTVEPVR